MSAINGATSQQEATATIGPIDHLADDNNVDSGPKKSTHTATANKTATVSGAAIKTAASTKAVEKEISTLTSSGATIKTEISTLTSGRTTIKTETSIPTGGVTTKIATPSDEKETQPKESNFLRKIKEFEKKIEECDSTQVKIEKNKKEIKDLYQERSNLIAKQEEILKSIGENAKMVFGTKKYLDDQSKVIKELTKITVVHRPLTWGEIFRAMFLGRSIEVIYPEF